MNRRTFLSIALVAPAFQQAGKKQPGKVVPPASLPPASSPGVPWTQWGGPHRNFQTEASGLKDTWPASGPRVIWKRSLGEGYSSPAVENGVLYTMYGKPKVEVVLATDAETGRTLWEQATPAAFQSDAPEQGNGPYSTPLIAGERLFTTGASHGGPSSSGTPIRARA